MATPSILGYVRYTDTPPVSGRFGDLKELDPATFVVVFAQAMSSHRSVAVGTVGLITGVGLTARSTAAAVRAGIARFRESDFYDQEGEPIVLAQVPLEQITELAGTPWAEQGYPDFSERIERMMVLAVTALNDCLRPVAPAERPPIYLALPEDAVDGPPFDRDAFVQNLLDHLNQQQRAYKEISVETGRAAAINLLQQAAVQIRNGSCKLAVVGGVDSFVDMELLEALEREGRLHTHQPNDGFIPGEGACCLLIGTEEALTEIGITPLAKLQALGLGNEPGHRYSQAVMRGEGLSAAFTAALTGLGGDSVRTVFAGFNGESLHGKEWGIAFLRHRNRFHDPIKMCHPADCFGDLGVALAPTLIGLAAVELYARTCAAPALAFCASDTELRGAAVLC